MKTKIITILAAAELLLPVSKVQAIDVDLYSDAIIRHGDDYDLVFVYDTSPLHSKVDMFGGNVFGFITHDSSKVNIHAGELEKGITTYDSSTLSIYDGTILLDTPLITGSSTLNIYGGDVRMGAPYAENSSTINIYGYDFSEFPAFGLTGYLSDGSSFEFIELTYAMSHINLIVIPEPASVLLLSLGILFLKKRK